MLKEISIEWKYCKSYASEAALRKKLEQEQKLYPGYNDRFVIVKTPEGRWTAIVKLDRTTGGYIGRYDFLKI